jgi:hypothetical protein
MSAVGFEGVFQQGSAFLAQPRDIIGDVVIRQMVEQNVDLLLALLRPARITLWAAAEPSAVLERRAAARGRGFPVLRPAATAAVWG